MIDLLGLISKTTAFKTVVKEKQKNALSHAYLILSKDKDNLKEYLKIFAKLILCEEVLPCGKCRSCALIDSQSYSDVIFLPREKDVVLTEDINYLIEESFYKPIEAKKKVFVISGAETMNAPSQNKLLKTLEEPPENVIIILGATSEYPLLSTVKSRVKRLEIPCFSDDELFSALKAECDDVEKLKNAIACGDKTVGGTKELYGDKDFSNLVQAVEDVLVNMKASSSVLTYSNKLAKLKCDVEKFLSVLEVKLNDFMLILNGKQDIVSDKKSIELFKRTTNFTLGSIVYILEKIVLARKKKIANVNDATIMEWTLFQILEGKHKWLKL